VSVPHGDLYDLGDVYDAMFSWDPRDEALFLVEVFRRFAGSVRRVLDVGCGTGRVARALASMGLEVLCLDISHRMLSRCRGAAGVEPLCSDAAAPALRTGVVDAAYSLLATLNHLDPRALEAHIAEASRVLRRGGVYVVDLVVEEPPCLGLCDEWETSFRGEECVARHIVEEVRSGRMVEVLELVCGGYVVARSRAELYLYPAQFVVETAKRMGFEKTLFLKPFTLELESRPSGRVFAVLLR